MTSQNQISIIFIFLIIVSCNKKNDEWTQTNFDKNISQNDSIKMMNKLYDPEEFYNDSISGKKKHRLLLTTMIITKMFAKQKS